MNRSVRKLNMRIARTLAAHHREEFEHSNVSGALVQAAGIRSVGEEVAHKLTGVNCGPGWAAPFKLPDGTIVEQVKPDAPYVFADGHQAKYLWPKGAPSRFYFPPGVESALNVVGTVLLITEGVKKALAAVGAGLKSIGLIGVWNWTKDGKAISDFDFVKWEGRTAIIAFDSDTFIKPQVAQAQRRLAWELEGRGATVKVLRVPHPNDGTKVGIDDGLAVHGPTWLNGLVQDASDLLCYEVQRLQALSPSHRMQELTQILADAVGCLQPLRLEAFLKGLSDALDIPLRTLHDQARHISKQRAGKVLSEVTASPDALNGIRRSLSLPSIQIRQAIALAILKDLLEKGKMLRSDRGNYYLDAVTGAVLDVAEPEFMALCAQRYGCNSAELEWHHVLSDINSHAIAHGKKVIVRELAYYDKQRNTLYVDAGSGMLWLLDGTCQKTVSNGTNGVFLRTPGYQAVAPLTTNEVTWGNTVLSLACIDEQAGICTEFATLLLQVWIWGIFFPEILPTRPLLCLVGEKGSAKSSTIRAIGRAIFGTEFDVTAVSENLSDLETMLANARLVGLDNLDTEGPRRLMDLLAVCATGGEITRRKLYTTATEIHYRISCFLAMTSRTPTFRREDVSERLLLINTARLRKFKPENKLMETVQKRRRRLWYRLLGELNRIVRQLKDWDSVETLTAYRLSDFANFGLRAVPADQQSKWKNALAALQDAQNSFALEKDAVAKGLRTWLRRNARCTGQEFKASEIRLKVTSEGAVFPCSVEQLGRRLKNPSDVLRAWFRIDHRNKDGITRYRLWLKATAKG